MGSFIIVVMAIALVFYIANKKGNGTEHHNEYDEEETKQNIATDESIGDEVIDDKSIEDEVKVSASSDKASITINSLGDLARAAASAYGRNVYETFCKVGANEVIERLMKINTKEAALYGYFTTIVVLYLNPFNASKEELEKELQKKEKELAFFCNKHGVELYMSANHGYIITEKGYFEVWAKIPYSVRKRVGMPILPREKELHKILVGACLNDKETLEKALTEYFEENQI